MSHWAEQYIGIPWESGATGPDSYDCWGFFRHVMLNHYQLDIPAVDVDANNIKDVMNAFSNASAYANWSEVDLPVDGDAVLMAHAKSISHIGVWVETPALSGVLHCVFGIGVVFSSQTSLSMSGWGKKNYYRYLWD